MFDEIRRALGLEHEASFLMRRFMIFNEFL